MHRSGLKAQGQGPVGKIQAPSCRLVVPGVGEPAGDLVTQASVGQLGVIMFAGPLPGLEPLPRWLGPVQAPGRPVLGRMTHRFLSTPGPRKCSRRLGALPLADQADWMLVG